MRRAIALTLVIPLLLAIPLLSGCQSESKKHLYKAEDYFEKKDFENAQKELRLSIQADPNNVDAHKSLSRIDDFMGESDEACREYEKVSELDPSDQKAMQKARMCHAIQEMVNNASKGVDEVKSGDAEGGMRTLKDALQASKSAAVREKVIGYIRQAIPIIVQQGDQQAKDKKYADALKTYIQAIHGYMYLAEASIGKNLDPAAGPVLHSANLAAKNQGTPEATDEMFKVLNDILGLDPSNKDVNMELAQVYIAKGDYGTAADLEEAAGAPDADVKKLRDQAKRHRQG